MTPGRGTSLDLFTDGLKCAESVLWRKPGGLEAHLCDALQPHTVTVWETEPVHDVAQATSTFSAPSPWLFGLKLQLPHSPSPPLFHIQSGMYGVLIWTAHVQLNTTWESQVGSWVCCIQLAQKKDFQSLSHGFILQIYSMLHILNLTSYNFPRSPSKWLEVMFISCFGKV